MPAWRRQGRGRTLRLRRCRHRLRWRRNPGLLGYVLGSLYWASYCLDMYYVAYIELPIYALCTQRVELPCMHCTYRVWSFPFSSSLVLAFPWMYAHKGWIFCFLLMLTSSAWRGSRRSRFPECMRTGGWSSVNVCTQGVDLPFFTSSAWSETRREQKYEKYFPSN